MKTPSGFFWLAALALAAALAAANVAALVDDRPSWTKACFGRGCQRKAVLASSPEDWQPVARRGDSTTIDTPWYWDNTGRRRQVHLAMYPYKNPSRWYQLHRHIGNVFMHFLRQHWEVHVGETAFTIRADPTSQEIQYRPVRESQRVFGMDLYKKKFMCETRKTDDEIVEYLRHTWQGPYDIFETACDQFSKRVIQFVCERQKPKSRYPLANSYILEPLRKLGRHARKNAGKNNPLGWLEKTFEEGGELKGPMTDIHEWEVKEFKRMP